MNMLVLYSRESTLSEFAVQYAKEEFRNVKEHGIFCANNVNSMYELMGKQEFDYIVFDLEFVLQVCTSKEREMVFACGKTAHVTVLGETGDFCRLSREEQGCVNVFHNLDLSVFHKNSRIREFKNKRAMEERASDLFREALIQVSRGKKYGALELKTVGEYLNLWDCQHKMFVLLVNFYGTPLSILNQIHAYTMEEAIDLDNSESCLIQYIAGGRTSFYGVISNHDKNYRTVNNQFARNYCNFLRHELKKKYGDELMVTIGISSLKSMPDQIPEMFEEARKAEYNRVYSGAGKDFFYGEQEGKRIKFRRAEHISELKKCIEARNMESVRQELQFLFDEAAQAKLEELALQALLVEIMSLIFNLCVEENIDLAEVNEYGSAQIEFSFIEAVESIERERDSFIEYFQRVLKKVGERRKMEEGYSAKIRKAMNYIYEHYTENLFLKNIADALDISANYLCTIFKKETGMKVIEFVNQVRIEKAKDLVINTNSTAAMVGEMVGFSDTAYFCTVFKRYTGETITEYRKKYSE